MLVKSSTLVLYVHSKIIYHFGFITPKSKSFEIMDKNICDTKRTIRNKNINS